MTYNNQQNPIVLPEYGRNFQKMLERCLMIEDRDERTFCARSIIDAMSIIFQPQGDKYRHRLKLWNQLALMSDYRLDVDLPFELVRPEGYEDKPEPVALGSGHSNRREYGCHLELMVSEAAKMPEGEERDELIFLLANQMKKNLLAVNPEGVEDERVFQDLFEMSEGRINISTEQMKLHDFKITPVATKKKKKK